MGTHTGDAVTSPTALGPRGLADAMRAFSAALHAHRGTLNRLNVYPVPDGDTGTNMALTAQAVVERLEGGDGEGSGVAMAEVCVAIAQGSLMGARGNSGVILCQILRGLASSFAGLETVDAPALVAALQAGSAQAREAVLRPVEGTILTVAAAAATGADAAGGVDLVAALEGARSGALEALWRTPELLPVLAVAGVVDAGGAGLVLLFDALLHVVDGRSLPDELELPEDVAALVASGLPAGEVEVDPEGVRSAPPSLRYEVMYFLEAADEAIPAFKEVWAGLGDSIVVVGGDGLWSCHVHTDDIGGAIEAALDVGRPREIRVTDLAEQVEEEQWVRQGATVQGGPADLPAGPPPRTSVVAVANGEGVRRIFTSLGAQDIVVGGQSMNPSTAELLAAVEAAVGSEVVLLPNNANILPVAAQVASLAGKPVRVVPTRGIQEGFAALLEYDPQCSSDENRAAMETAASRVVAGEVTRAVRASETPAGRVEPGDFIGLSRKGVEVVATTLEDATCGLLERLIEPDHEIVTLIEGAGSSPAETRKVTEWVRSKHPGLSIERHSGGQPLYPYLVSIE